MSTIQFQEKLLEYRHWREGVIRGLERYARWLYAYDCGNDRIHETLREIRDNLRNDRLMVAFAAEFSRGKTELINALFFADTGVRLLPSSPGRTTMCPTEIFHDPREQGAYIRLLPIETRLSEVPLSEYRQTPAAWLQIDLDPDSPAQMQEAFKELAAMKTVYREEAVNLGLWNEDFHEATSLHSSKTVEIPRWRHALISFPHKLLKEGLSILDTPGLNSLGAEPELTLRMLPSAQAIVFVLTADTGATRSDLDIWVRHVKGARELRKKGFAVALNKIDSMWDDLQGEDSVESAIRSQVLETSRLLGLDVNLIYPVSAKQALLAKVRKDPDLLKKSRLSGIEDFLSGEVIRNRRFLLQQGLNEALGDLIEETLSSLSYEIAQGKNQLDKLKEIDVENQELIGGLLEDTRKDQTRYIAGLESFHSGTGVFKVQMKRLMEALSPATINPFLRSARSQMMGSMTTVGMKDAMKTALEDLMVAMEKALALAEETRGIVSAIYGRFEEEWGFGDLKPLPFSLKAYQIELEKVCELGELYRQSAAATLTEQGAAVQRLYGTVITEACGLFVQAHHETMLWGGKALTPLAQRIHARKRAIDARLEVLRKISESRQGLEIEMAGLEQGLSMMRKQYQELKEISQILSPV